MRKWQKVTGLAILEGLWNINHSLALSHYWSTRGLLAAGFPPWPDSPFIRQPGLVGLPRQDHVEANLSADARSTWVDETQNSPPQDFHSNWPPSSWITRTCQSSRSRGFVFLSLIYRSKIICVIKNWRCGGLNPGPFTCKANALPLSYIPWLWMFSDFCANDFFRKMGLKMIGLRGLSSNIASLAQW